MKTIEIAELRKDKWREYLKGKELVVGYAQMPGGKVGVGVVGEFLVCLAYVDDVELHMKERLDVKVVKYDDGIVRRTLEKLKAGEGKLLLVGSEFERAIWKVLLKILPGQTVSYQWVADQVGKAKAVRAVGSAIGRNPIAYWVPCHRVVRSDGGMGGYAYGLEIKQQLLQLETA